MAFSQADIDNLKAAIAESGLNGTVRYADGSSIQNITMDNAVKLLNLMQADVSAVPVTYANPLLRPVRAIRAYLSGGY